MPSAKKFACLAIGVLVLLSLLIAAERVRTYHEPLERDITTYAVIGAELLKGRSLYSDLWDHKPPGIYLIYAGMEAITGEGPASIYLLGVLAAIITLYGVYYAGLQLYGDRMRALWPALFWSIIASDLVLQANQPNSEVFLNALMVWGFALVISADVRTPNRTRWVLIGALFAAATLIKYSILPVWALLIAIHLGSSWKDKRERKTAISQVVISALAIVLAWAAVVLHFLLAGHIKDFYDTVIIFNWFYADTAGGSLSNLLSMFRFSTLFNHAVYNLISLLVLTLFSLAMAMRNKPRRRNILLLGYLVAAEISVVLPGHGYAHYYQLLMPPFVLGAGWAISLAADVPVSRLKIGPQLIGLIVAIALIVKEAPYYSLTASEWSAHKYGQEFILCDQVAGRVKSLLEPGESFYEWGNESGLYFSTRKSPASGIIQLAPMLTGPLTDVLSNRAIKDLDHTQPELFVCATKYPFVGDTIPPVVAWAIERYGVLPTMSDSNFIFMVRYGGRLQARLAADHIDLRALEMVPP